MFRLPWMYGAILGFQRETRCPKWTPESTSALISSACDCGIQQLQNNGHLKMRKADSPCREWMASTSIAAIRLGIRRNFETTREIGHTELPGIHRGRLLASQVVNLSPVGTILQVILPDGLCQSPKSNPWANQPRLLQFPPISWEFKHGKR